MLVLGVIVIVIGSSKISIVAISIAAISIAIIIIAIICHII